MLLQFAATHGWGAADVEGRLDDAVALAGGERRDLPVWRLEDLLRRMLRRRPRPPETGGIYEMPTRFFAGRSK
jgi:hypothetical protein